MTIRYALPRAFAVVSIVSVLLPGFAASSPGNELSSREAFVLGQICAQCHARPGIGAPLIGDEEEWRPRRAGGFDRLLTNTIEGYLGMPPLGTCSFCTEDELRRLVSIISGMPTEEGQ